MSIPSQLPESLSVLATYQLKKDNVRSQKREGGQLLAWDKTHNKLVTLDASLFTFGNFLQKLFWFGPLKDYHVSLASIRQRIESEVGRQEKGSACLTEWAHSAKGTYQRKAADIIRWIASEHHSFARYEKQESLWNPLVDEVKINAKFKFNAGLDDRDVNKTVVLWISPQDSRNDEIIKDKFIEAICGREPSIMTHVHHGWEQLSNELKAKVHIIYKQDERKFEVKNEMSKIQIDIGTIYKDFQLEIVEQP